MTDTDLQYIRGAITTTMSGTTNEAYRLRLQQARESLDRMATLREQLLDLVCEQGDNVEYGPSGQVWDDSSFEANAMHAFEHAVEKTSRHIQKLIENYGQGEK